MATPRVLGQLFRFTANLCFARDAAVPRLSALETYGAKVALGGASLYHSGERTQQWLIGPTTTGANADHSSSTAVNHLLGAGGQLDTGLPLVRVVAHDGDIVARGSAQAATVAGLLLHVRHDGTLGNGGQR